MIPYDTKPLAFSLSDYRLTDLIGTFSMLCWPRNGYTAKMA